MTRRDGSPDTFGPATESAQLCWGILSTTAAGSVVGGALWKGKGAYPILKVFQFGEAPGREGRVGKRGEVRADHRTECPVGRAYHRALGSRNKATGLIFPAVGEKAGTYVHY
jgi:hypothetical protein